MEPSTAIMGGLIGWREALFESCGCPSLCCAGGWSVGEGFSDGDRTERMEPSTAIMGGLIGCREVMFGNCGCPGLH